MNYEELESDYDKAMTLLRVLEDAATGGVRDETNFSMLRKYFYGSNKYKSYIPKWLNSVFNLGHFWGFIKPKYDTYAERRSFLAKEFEHLIDYCQGSDNPLTIQTDIIQDFDYEGIKNEWTKMLERVETDPPGAITSSRSLLETVCKHILDERWVAYSNNEALTALYSLVAKELNLHNKQHDDPVVKDILNGCGKIINGIQKFRNDHGDAHGKGIDQINPLSRHARLTVNTAGTMSLFLIETHNYRKGK